MRHPPPPDPAADEAGPRPYFLLTDDRFRVPIFVFVELDPRRPGRSLGRAVRPVTVEVPPLPAGRRQSWVGIGPGSAVARHPQAWDRFRVFPSDREAQAAGFLPMEPRYVGPSWESYLAAFRPEGERPVKGSVGAAR